MLSVVGDDQEYDDTHDPAVVVDRIVESLDEIEEHLGDHETALRAEE